MHLIWLMTGLLLLLIARITGSFIAHRNAAHHGVLVQFRSLHLPGRCLQRLKRTCQTTPDFPALEALRSCALPLYKSLLRIKAALRQLPPLPVNTAGQPRMMDLGYQLCDDAIYSTDGLLSALQDWQDFTPTPIEIAALPYCVALAQVIRLNAVLRVIHQDMVECKAAKKAYRKLRRSKEPIKPLQKANLNCAGLYALHQHCLRRKNERILAVLIAHLDAHELSPDDLVKHFTEQQRQLTDELHRALDCFTSLEALDWQSACEAADRLHAILLQDPSGAYAGMTMESRYRLRKQAEIFSRHTQQDVANVVSHALALSRAAPSGTAESCICYWFMESAGLRTLRTSRKARHGWLWCRLALAQDTLYYAGLWAFAIVSSLLFLQARQPVFMLPFFAWTVGCLSRHFLHSLTHRQLLQMQLPTTISGQTLVVLPSLLSDASIADQMARRLHTLSQTLPQDVHLLLLGDFGPSITPTGGTDYEVMHAVTGFITATGNPRLHYLQRARSWDSAQHRYIGRGGCCGAIFDLCRLIAQGTDDGTFLPAFDAPSSFERAYAYVLTLPDGYQLLSGLPEQLLSVMIHPLYSRIPTADGWRGVSIVTPDQHCLADGMMLLRPDLLTEAVDSIIAPSPATFPLWGELAGCTFAPDSSILPPSEKPSWSSVYESTRCTWQLLPWQLTHVQTPAGFIANPLSFFGRFRLRETMRKALIPLGRLGLLLWSVLTEDWPLFLIALAVPEIGQPLHHRDDFLRMLSRLSLLPMNTTVHVLGIFDGVFRKRIKAYDFPSIEVWVQSIAVTVFASLGFALPSHFSGTFLLALLFAGFPLAHKHK